MQNIRNWKIRPELELETRSHYRDHIFSKIKGLTALDKVKIVTFDGIAPNVSLESAQLLINFVNNKIAKDIFKGVGVEVGAGCGFFSAILSQSNTVKEIYAVEISRTIVDEIMPEILAEFGGKYGDKIIPCVGDFSNMEIPDSTVDFVFDFFSLHHSDDLDTTFREISRILKPGGSLVCLDKARNNELSEAELEMLLDKEYSVEAKKIMGIDQNKFWTRRMNGEKEFRLKDWVRFARNNSLSLSKFFHVSRTNSPSVFIQLAKELISYLPVSIQIKITSALGFDRIKHPNSLENRNIIFSKSLNVLPKEISVMIFTK